MLQQREEQLPRRVGSHLRAMWSRVNKRHSLRIGSDKGRSRGGRLQGEGEFKEPPSCKYTRPLDLARLMGSGW